MRANKGDKIVCVLKGCCRFITIGEIYEILDVDDYGRVHIDGVKLYSVRNDIGRVEYYSMDKFISLSEWREKQINKII